MKKEKSERFTITLGEDLADFVRNYRYTRISQFEDIEFTVRDVFVIALETLAKTTTMEVIERPANVKKNEEIKKTRRTRAIQAGKQAKKLAEEK